MPFFTQSAVAFLDVLGFKNLIGEAEKSASGCLNLVALKNLVESHVKFDNETIDATVPLEAHPKYIFVSDSIILSAPLECGQYDGLQSVVLKTVQIAQKVMELGHLIRGGISVGSVWHVENNIFGSGYIDAYLTEDRRALQPRILLSQAAAEIWKAPSRWASDLCLEDEGLHVVDILHAQYLRSNAAQLPMEGYFNSLRVTILTNLESLPLGSEPRSKWEWMAGFYNRALKRHQLSSQPFSYIPIPI
jgi:hypothetical protein